MLHLRGDYTTVLLGWMLSGSWNNSRQNLLYFLSKILTESLKAIIRSYWNNTLIPLCLKDHSTVMDHLCQVAFELDFLEECVCVCWGGGSSMAGPLWRRWLTVNHGLTDLIHDPPLLASCWSILERFFLCCAPGANNHGVPSFAFDLFESR